MATPSIDIVIVNYRGAADTLQALARLVAWPHGTLWLVDNSAHETDMADQTASLLAASTRLPWVTHLATGSNLGFGRACNLAFAHSRAEFFLLLNPDARIATEDVLLLSRTLTDQPELGAVSPKMFWNAQRSFVLPAAFPQTPWVSLAMAWATRMPRVMGWVAQIGMARSMRQMAVQEFFEVDFLTGAVMMLRRSAVLSAGGLFDPDYFMFFEDSDLSLRLRKAGYKLAIVSRATAEHEYRHKEFKNGLMAQSQQQYFSKRFPAFYRWSRGLARISALARPVTKARWFVVLPQPVDSAAEFTELTDGAGVAAFSPSLLMMPAIFRASFAQARPFDEDEWALLEPAIYVALLVDAADSGKRHWVCFERASTLKTNH